MQHQRPTPTCVRFRVTEVPCAQCGQTMLLKLLEPRSPVLDTLTYRCLSCNVDEIFVSSSR